MPAKNDVEHLKSLFRDGQNFDEVILLENGDVNLINLNYFLQTYMIQTANRYDKVRLVFAYSGHGVPPTAQGDKSYLVLSDAKDGDDLAHFLNLGVLRQYFSNLAPHLFQFLALINTCYGGDVFGSGLSGGDIFETSATAANALTAGAPDQLVYSLGQPGEGSIFFDSIVRGIENEEALASFHTSDRQGHTLDIKWDVIRLGDLFRYVHDTVKSINGYLGTDYSNPWEGSVAPPPAISLGGFFFLPGKKPVAVAVQNPASPGNANPNSFAFGRRPASRAHPAPTLPPVPAAPSMASPAPNPPPGPTSSFVGEPEVKIFKTPDEYPIKGIDVSQYNGEVDWRKVENSKIGLSNITFAFIRATMGAARQDSEFKRNWEDVSTTRLAKGIYHVVDFCDDFERQAQNIVNHVAVDPAMLPIMLDIFYDPLDKRTEWVGKQVECYNQIGRGEVRRRLSLLTQRIYEVYKKVPAMFGGKSVFGEVVGDEFKRNAVWLHDYAGKGTGTALPGNNPWTFWQFTDEGKIDGISGPVDESAFFSTPKDFATYAAKGENISLAAALASRRNGVATAPR